MDDAVRDVRVQRSAIARARLSALRSRTAVVVAIAVLAVLVSSYVAITTGLLWPRLTIESTVGQEWFANAETRRAEITLTLRNRGLPAVDVVDLGEGGDALQVDSAVLPQRPIARGQDHAIVVGYTVKDCARADDEPPIEVGVQRWWGTQRQKPALSADARSAWQEMIDFACGRF